MRISKEIQERFKRSQTIEASRVIDKTTFNALREKTRAQFPDNTFKQNVDLTRRILNLSFQDKKVQKKVYVDNKEARHDIKWIDKVFDQTLNELNSELKWN